MNDDERPRAPWHPVPLAELCVLVAIILLITGVIVGLGNDRGRVLLVTGLALGSLGGLDTAVREHWAGYAPHHTSFRWFWSVGGRGGRVTIGR